MISRNCVQSINRARNKSIYHFIKEKNDGINLKNRLKELRARDGINQTELAKLTGVSRQTISLIERGEYTPSVIIAMKISQVFKESLENVFSLVSMEE